MARFRISHGADIEVVTPAEAAAILQAYHERDRPQRVRASATVKLDANGNGQDEVYAVPAGYEFAARRVFLDLDTATDPQTGSVPLDTSSVSQSIVQVANPAAGADWIYTVPAGLRQRVITAHAFLVASATVANRNVRWTFIDAAANILAKVRSQFVQAASTTGDYTVAVAALQPVIGGSSILAESIPSIWLPAGAGFGPLPGGSGLQVGDQWNSIFLTLETQNALARAVEYLRSGQRIEYAAPDAPNGGDPQIPGIQTWGAEQGPYLRNGEVFEVKARGLTANAILGVTLEGILSRPFSPSNK